MAPRAAQRRRSSGAGALRRGFTAIAFAAVSGGSFGDVLAAAVGATVPAGAASVPAGALLGAMTGALPNSPARAAMAGLGRIGGAVVGSTAGAKAAALEVASVALVIGALDNAFGCRE